jgi:DNA-binding NtrC family response regulator
MAKILIVDDEEDVGRLLKRFLGKRFEAEAVLDLRSAEAYLANHAPDVVLLDNNLPDGSGIEYIPALKQHLPHVQVIAISAMGHLHDRAIELGAFVFLEKPLSMPVLQTHIIKALETQVG